MNTREPRAEPSTASGDAERLAFPSAAGQTEAAHPGAPNLRAENISCAEDLSCAEERQEGAVVAQLDDDELVAYLDGEIPPGDAAAIEKRLGEDAEYRQRLRELQQAWDLLDLIPRAEVEETFTRSTVEMVAVTAADEAEKAQSRWRRSRWLLRLAAAVAVLVSAACGFAAAAWVLDGPNRRLIADLPLLMDLHLYRQTESLEFLDELEKRRLLAEPAADLAGQAPSRSAPDVAYSPDASERRRALSSLPDAELESLRRKKEQFESLPPQEQEQLRRLANEVAAASDSAERRELMGRYNEWLKTIASADRAALRELSGAAKADKVAELIKAQEAERFAELMEGRLAKDDLEKIYAWLDRFVQDRESQIMAALPKELPEEFRRRLREADDAGRRRMLAVVLFRASPGESRLPRPSAEQVTALKDTLSPEAQAVWDKASEAERPMLAQKWIAAAFWSKAPPPVSEEQLREFFKTRDAKEREWLERLPPERMARELRRLYYRHQFQSDRRGDPRRPSPLGREGAGPSAGAAGSEPTR